MWFDGQRQPDTLYVASVSRGKDSTAMLRAIQIMGWPLDYIISVDIWATQDIPAELPPMVAFKDKWDDMCAKLFGIPVTRICAQKKDGSGKLSYEDAFYRKVTIKNSKNTERIMRNNGFPIQISPWCQKLKVNYVKSERDAIYFSNKLHETNGKLSVVNYLGIASDEHKRIVKHINKPDEVMPLVQIGWNEDLCGLIATYLGMLSPTYNDSFRDGCWFCHNQSIDQMRLLRKNYPDLWNLLLKWDNDSPIAYRADGHTVHDFDKRFELEDNGVIDTNKRFYWKYIDDYIKNER